VTTTDIGSPEFPVLEKFAPDPVLDAPSGRSVDAILEALLRFFDK
jgi:hypothetical protein